MEALGAVLFVALHRAREPSAAAAAATRAVGYGIVSGQAVAACDGGVAARSPLTLELLALLRALQAGGGGQGEGGGGGGAGRDAQGVGRVGDRGIEADQTRATRAAVAAVGGGGKGRPAVLGGAKRVHQRVCWGLGKIMGGGGEEWGGMGGRKRGNRGEGI